MEKKLMYRHLTSRLNGKKSIILLTSAILLVLTQACQKDQVTPVSDDALRGNLPIANGGGLAAGRSTNVISLFTGFNSSSGPSVYKGDGIALGSLTYSGSTFWTLAGTTTGDFDGDGQDEFITAFNSSGGPALYKNLGSGFSNAVKIYQGSTFWTIVGVAAADFDGDGKDELITALNSSGGPALYKGDATSIGYQKIYQGPTSLSVVAVAAGDFNGAGMDELIVAFNSGNGPSLYRGQGANVGSSFYQGSTFWTLAALTASDFDNDGRDELITGLNSSGGPALYKGDATTIGYVKIYQGSTYWTLSALTSGKFGSTCKLYIGYNSVDGPAVYEHNGTSFVVKMYQGSNTQSVKALAAGNL